MMKLFAPVLFLLLSAGAARASDLNHLVLEAVGEMPRQGGYVLTAASPRNLRAAFAWDEALEELGFEPAKAIPSYCTTATYAVFYRALQKFWAQSGSRAQRETLELLVPALEADGVRIWGRWNSNGPGTAKLFTDTGLGRNFDDLRLARPGDFLKIFWNAHVGKRERGHTVIYLGHFVRGGVEMIRFWGSNASTNGYGVKEIPRKDAVRMLFSRLERPENLDELLRLPVRDEFLASMLSRESNWREVRQVSGF
jgi:hypothetical protein